MKLKNNNLLAEIRKLNDDKENDNVNEKTNTENKIKIEPLNDICSNIEALYSKGSLYLNRFILN